MKDTELRIGNWLQYANGGYFTVEAVDFYTMPSTNKEYHPLPIPLTEDILLKCGFEKNESIDYRLHYPHFPITIDIDDFGLQLSDSWEFKSCKYLHQLQNLYFALTGEELKIEL